MAADIVYHMTPGPEAAMTDRRRRHPNGLGQGFAHEKLPPVMQMIMRLTGGRDDEGFEIQGTVQGARRVVSGDDDDLHLLIVGTRRDAEGVPFRIVPRLVEPLFRQLTQQRVASRVPTTTRESAALAVSSRSRPATAAAGTGVKSPRVSDTMSTAFFSRPAYVPYTMRNTVLTGFGICLTLLIWEHRPVTVPSFRPSLS